MDTKTRKAKLRERIWRIMQERDVAKFPLPCFGRIPNFQGEDLTARKTRELEEWKSATSIFVSPDSPAKKNSGECLEGRKNFNYGLPEA